MHLFEPGPPEPAGLGSGFLLIGDALRALEGFDDATFQAVVTSPPYWGLRDYGMDGQIGAEPTVDGFVERLVKVFSEVRRTLRDDGTLWLNIGDSYTSGGRTWRQSDKKLAARGMSYRPATPEGLKPKDLIGVPWRLASALQLDGWYLRSEVIWQKPNVQPESVKDRPARSHEFVFMLTKSERYLYNYDAVKVPTDDGRRMKARKDVWSINTEAFPDAHFATFPTGLVTPCVLASSNEGDVVLDPFFGSGTVGEVCINLGRKFVGIELSSEYAEVARRRLLDRSKYELEIRGSS